MEASVAAAFINLFVAIFASNSHFSPRPQRPPTRNPGFRQNRDFVNLGLLMASANGLALPFSA